MKPLKHSTAKASYYNTRASVYDAFNEHTSKATNAFLEKIIRQHGASTVLDLTCGTGSQVLWLHDAGFEVVGVDINQKMLTIAKQKAKAKRVNITFLKGDCRTTVLEKCDVVITIFNAIGHLTREDFRLTIQNIGKNLKPGGLYIFDIFNLDYLTHERNITKLTIDWLSADRSVREIQFSTITDDGILASYSTYVTQEGHSQPTKIAKGYGNTLQCYAADGLKAMLEGEGFIVVQQTGITGERFSRLQTERILTIARKT